MEPTTDTATPAAEPDTAAQARADAHAAMAATLRAWAVDGLIHPDWKVDWAPGNEGAWVATFHTTGCPGTHALPQAEFDLYALGFTQRPIAVRNRTPRTERTPFHVR